MRAARLVFERQWLHALCLAALLAGARFATRFDAVTAGSLWGLTAGTWLWIALWIAVTHQVFVWLCWRLELHVGLLGMRGFRFYAAGFAVLGISRVVAVFVLSIANRDTVDAPGSALPSLAILMLIPAIYLFHSVRRHFGFVRAVGIDHFDASYRTKPFVKEGIFRFTDNGMYVYGFFLLWVPALWWNAAGGLVAAAFNHAYIWVHYWSTERPDIRRIYGTGPST